MFGISYSRLINGLTKANVKIDRKVLADIAVRDIDAFGKIAEIAKAGADTFVAGSAIFGKPDYRAIIEQMRAALNAI